MTARGRFFLFASPATDRGYRTETAAMLGNIAQRMGGTLLGLETESGREFMALVSQTIRDGDWVVLAGDDGTLHQGLNASVGREVTVGYIPLGTVTGAGYALGLLEPGAAGLLQRPNEEALYDMLSRGSVIDLDLVRLTTPIVERAVFALFVDVGWCAMIARERAGNSVMGHLRPAVRNLVGEYFEQTATVTVDGRPVWQGPNTFVAVAKSPYSGTGIPLVPAARLDDGLLHTTVYQLTRAEIASLYASSWVGHTPRPTASKAGRRVEIVATAVDLPLAVDGTYLGETNELLCEVLPQALRMITGEQPAPSPPLPPTTETECGHCQHAIDGGEAFRCTRCQTLYHTHCWQNYSRCSNGSCGSVLCDVVHVAHSRSNVAHSRSNVAHSRSNVAHSGSNVAQSRSSRRAAPAPTSPRRDGSCPFDEPAMEQAQTDSEDERLCCHCGNPIDSWSLPCPFCGDLPR